MSTQSYQVGTPDDSQPESKPGAHRWDSKSDTVSPITPNIRSGSESSPVAPGVRVTDANERRMSVEFKNGEVRVVQHQHASSTNVPTSTDPLENGRDGTWGNSIPRNALKGDSIIKGDVPAPVELEN